MSVVKWEIEGGVAVITMDAGENRHNAAFVDGMLAALDAVEADKNACSVLLCSSDPKNWSLGIDLPWLMGKIQNQETEELKTFLYNLNRLLSRMIVYPMPIIAAITGHCFANGGVLACACDFRFMKSDRGYFCFPEIDINIPFLPGMVELARRAFPPDLLTDIILSGRRLGAEELARRGVIVEACADAEATLARSREYAETFKKERPIFAEMKRRFNRPILEVIEREDPKYIDTMQLIAWK